MNKDTLKGDMKETVGKVTNDKSTEAKGKLDSFVGKMKDVAHDASEKIQDTVEDVKEKLDGDKD